MTSPKLAQENPDGSRSYVHPITQEAVPSVTTIMRAGIGKPMLVRWSARLAADYAIGNWADLQEMPLAQRREMIWYAHERERGKASDLGSAVHSACDAWAKGKAHEYSKEVSPYMTSFTKFIMDKRPEFLFSEVTLWNRKREYAGTADAICRIGGETYLIDYKTGKSLHAEVALQLSALENAEFIITDEGEELPVPQIDRLAAVHIRPRSWHFSLIAHRENAFRAFLACRDLHFWTEIVAPETLVAA